MNREIKFRGWYVKGGKTIMITFGIEGVPKELELKLDYTTVQQFTGLLDKNGKEIWEGDVVKFKSGFGNVDNRPFITDTVRFDGGAFMPFWDICYTDDEQGNPIVGDTLEVIGNIYENPNLLNQ